MKVGTLYTKSGYNDGKIDIPYNYLLYLHENDIKEVDNSEEYSNVVAYSYDKENNKLNMGAELYIDINATYIQRSNFVLGYDDIEIFDTSANSSLNRTLDTLKKFGTHAIVLNKLDNKISIDEANKLVRKDSTISDRIIDGTKGLVTNIVFKDLYITTPNILTLDPRVSNNNLLAITKDTKLKFKVNPDNEIFVVNLNNGEKFNLFEERKETFRYHIIQDWPSDNYGLVNLEPNRKHFVKILYSSELDIDNMKYNNHFEKNVSWNITDWVEIPTRESNIEYIMVDSFKIKVKYISDATVELSLHSLYNDDIEIDGVNFGNGAVIIRSVVAIL